MTAVGNTATRTSASCRRIIPLRSRSSASGAYPDRRPNRIGPWPYDSATAPAALAFGRMVLAAGREDTASHEAFPVSVPDAAVPARGSARRARPVPTRISTTVGLLPRRSPAAPGVRPVGVRRIPAQRRRRHERRQSGHSRFAQLRRCARLPAEPPGQPRADLAVLEARRELSIVQSALPEQPLLQRGFPLLPDRRNELAAQGKAGAIHRVHPGRGALSSRYHHVHQRKHGERERHLAIRYHARTGDEDLDLAERGPAPGDTSASSVIVATSVEDHRHQQTCLQAQAHVRRDPDLRPQCERGSESPGVAHVRRASVGEGDGIGKKERRAQGERDERLQLSPGQRAHSADLEVVGSHAEGAAAQVERIERLEARVGLRVQPDQLEAAQGAQPVVERSAEAGRIVNVQIAAARADVAVALVSAEHRQVEHLGPQGFALGVGRRWWIFGLVLGERGGRCHEQAQRHQVRTREMPHARQCPRARPPIPCAQRPGRRAPSLGRTAMVQSCSGVGRDMAPDALERDRRGMMRRQLALILVAVLPTAVMADQEAAAAEPAKAAPSSKRELDGHVFAPSLFVIPPFRETTFQLGLLYGVGNATGPTYDSSGNVTGTQDLSLAALAQTFNYEYRFLEWLSAGVTAVTLAYTGISHSRNRYS